MTKPESPKRRLVPRDSLNLTQQATRIVFERFRGVRPSQEEMDTLDVHHYIRDEVMRIFSTMETVGHNEDEEE